LRSRYAGRRRYNGPYLFIETRQSLTAGADLQDDRVEISICGWNRDGVCYVLGHFVIWGEPDDDTLWRELEELLRTRWQHPFGKALVIEATAIDSGDGEQSRHSPAGGIRLRASLHSRSACSRIEAAVTLSGSAPGGNVKPP